MNQSINAAYSNLAQLLCIGAAPLRPLPFVTSLLYTALCARQEAKRGLDALPQSPLTDRRRCLHRCAKLQKHGITRITSKAPHGSTSCSGTQAGCVVPRSHSPRNLFLSVKQAKCRLPGHAVRCTLLASARQPLRRVLHRYTLCVPSPPTTGLPCLCNHGDGSPRQVLWS